MSEPQSASDTESLGHELLQVESHTMGDGRALCGKHRDVWDHGRSGHPCKR